MFIKDIELKNFRNYEDFSIDFDKKVNLVIGRNAQGKTNLIEAIYLTSIGRSFRTSHDGELIKFGEKSAFVRVNAEKEVTDTKVEITINSNSKKFIKKDGTGIRKTSQLLDNIIIVIFSPEDLKIVKDEPEKRRRFIDRELAQIKPAYYDCLANYKRILLQRNSYLKEDNIQRSILEIWDEQLVKYGSSLMKMRKDFIDQINEYSGKIHDNITNGKEKLRVEYDPNISFDEDMARQQEIFQESMARANDNDMRLRTTSKGPHKDDMQFFVNGINARNFGSQGQQRTCALSLKLAELDFIKEETGESGILLLDDVMSELDEERREYLIRALSGNQLFITATDIDQGLLESYPEAKIIRIEKGKISNC
jgi:DNA replication and repair protein RecF